MDGIMKAAVGGGGGGGGGGRVGIGEDDMSDGMQCSDHPYRTNPGGICAFCLQEKLGKLVSSSFPLPLRPSTSSSSSPSFRSDVASLAPPNAVAASSSLSLSLRPTSTNNNNNNNNNNNSQCQEEYLTRRSRVPFLLPKRKKKITCTPSSTSSDRAVVFKRSKSATTPARRNHHHSSVSCGDNADVDIINPKRRGGFWSFFYLSAKSTATAEKTADQLSLRGTTPSATKKCSGNSLTKKSVDIVIAGDDDDSPNSQATGSASSFERKVSRSRSVGCGSRSFSGDFFERISTGFGDCTLRRVESQREGKPKGHGSTSNIKERVKCGGIFGGFMITSSSSSSSSSSYWVSSSVEDHHHPHHHNMNGRSTPSVLTAPAGPLAHGKIKSWSWAFASPMRAFHKPSSKDGKSLITSEASKNTTPNLSAIPSLLAVRS